MDRMNIGEGKKFEMISKEYELNENNEDDHQDTLTKDPIINVSMDGAGLENMISTQQNQDEYCDSLEIFCQERITITNQALEQVKLVFKMI